MAQRCRLLTLAVLLTLHSLAAAAQEQRPAEFPGYPETRAIRILKGRADRLYEEGRYGRAHTIYAKRLAFFGDKYSQYMAGFLYLNGLGVPRDAPRALAWYRLAAQRGHPDLVRARDQLVGQLTADQQLAAHAYFREIDSVYGDRRVLERLIFADQRQLHAMTGSRIGATIGPVKILGRDGTQVDATSYYSAIELRMQARVELLKGRVEYSEFTVIEPDQAEARPQDAPTPTDSETDP